MSFRTGIGTSDADSITLMGRDLASELMGKVTLTELAFLLVQGRMPSPEQTRLFDAVLVSLADHGLTPTVLAARLTYTGAPESIQGAVAAGLLGAGSVFLGWSRTRPAFSTRSATTWRARSRARSRPAGASRALATRSTRCRTRARRGSTPSPRRPGSSGLICARLRELAEAHTRQTGRELPINGAGVAGAALADLGFPAALLRGFALLARTAGLLGHLAEEMEHPLGMPLYREVDERAKYDPPTGE